MHVLICLPVNFVNRSPIFYLIRPMQTKLGVYQEKKLIQTDIDRFTLMIFIQMLIY